MKQSQKRYLTEQSIHWIIWLIVFLAPLISNVLTEKQTVDQSLNWNILGRQWLKIIPFFVLFLINNYLLIPILFLKKRYTVYIITSLLVVLILFFGDLFSFQHPMKLEKGNTHTEMPLKSKPHGPEPDGIEISGGVADVEPLIGGHPDDHKISPPDKFHHQEQQMNLHRKDDHHAPDFLGREHRNMPAIIKISHFLSWLVTAILILGFNIAIRLLFQSMRDEEKMKELERERLSSELEYLKYQINPHFFMNTLNNIHALVDIDAEKAKSSIIELSKLMRYVLYESNNPKISLSREIQFIENYVTLMKLRYIDSVHVEIDIPSILPEVQIPPLLFISFVENAFKHGVSYREESHIKIELHINEDNTLTFHCVNSNFTKTEEKHHGVGLENISKRLKLLYESNYTLDIKKDDDIFDVLLIIPLS